MSDGEEFSENEFHYEDESEFQDNSVLTETNNERANDGNSQEEAVDIFLYALTLAFDSQRCCRKFS